MSSLSYDGVDSVIVIDNGSADIKAGFSHDTTPFSVFPSLVGKRGKENYIGNEAQSKRDILNIKYPIEYGLITNWDDMIKIWHHTFYNQLRASPEDHGVLLTERPFNPKIYREKMFEVMFDKFYARLAYVQIQAVLSLYSSGASTTGIVCDCGDGVSNTVPVYEGYPIVHAINKIELGGRAITNYLLKNLQENGNIEGISKMDTVKDIKEKLCYVSPYGIEEELKRFETIDYKLPDGQVIKVGSQRFLAPESFFSPIQIGMEYPGIHTLLNHSINKCQLDIRNDLYSNIVLCGGSTMFPGFSDRTYNEITKLNCKAGDNDSRDIKEVNVLAPPNRKYSAWIGGSILASLSSFEKMCVYKDEYDEYGPTIIHRKCF